MEIKEILIAIVFGIVFVGIMIFMFIGIRNHLREIGDYEPCHRKRKMFLRALRRPTKNPR